MTANILIVPGYQGSGESHWQTWLQTQLPNTRRLAGVDWHKPELLTWAKAIEASLVQAPGPSVIVAHSFGCLASARAIARQPERVAGILFVAPADPERFTLQGRRQPLDSSTPSIASELPEQLFNSRGLLIASQNDPWMKFHHAFAWAQRWRLGFYDAGHLGHINTESGFGPWPLIKLMSESLLALIEEDAQIRGKKAPKIIASSAHQHAQPAKQTHSHPSQLIYC